MDSPQSACQAGVHIYPLCQGERVAQAGLPGVMQTLPATFTVYALAP